MHTQPAVLEDDSTLPRALADFFIELSVGLQKYSMYPDGHPLLETAGAAMTRRLGQLLADAPVLSVGVARHQLVVDGVSSDANSLVLRDLALKLHRREIGGLRFMQGVTPGELTGVLKCIAREPAPMGEGTWSRITGLPSEGEYAEHQWPHVEIYPLNYDQLKLLDETDAGTSPEQERRSRAAKLWQRLARSALLSDALSGDHEAVSDDPVAMAKAMGERMAEAGFAKSAFEFVTQITSEIKTQGGLLARAIGARMSKMLRAMPPEALKRLLNIGGDAAQRRQLLRNASHTLDVNTVLELARVVASSNNHTMSEALLLLLSKLAKHAEEGDASRRGRADEALRANVRQLIDDWDGAALLPEDAYWQQLEKLTGEAPSPAVAEGALDVPAEALVQMSMEIETFGISAKHAVAEMVKRGRIAELIALVDAAPDSNKVVWTFRRHLDNTRTVRRLLQDRPINFDVLQRLVSRIGFPAAGALLDALEQEDDSDARFKLFEMLAALGPEIGAAVVARLPDGPWYLQRNLLLLLARLPVWPADFTPLPYASHPDARVRREAFALLLKGPRSTNGAFRDRAIVLAIGDIDERIARAGLTAALASGCPKEGVPVLIARLEAGSFDGMLGALAIRVLAPLKVPAVMKTLIRVCLAPKRRFRFWRALAPKTPITLAALGALAGSWSYEPAAKEILALAARQKDPEILAAIKSRVSA